MFLRKKKRWHFRPPQKTLFFATPYRFATLRTGRMLPNAETPQHHSGTWGSSRFYSLGHSATQIKDLCAAASKNDVRKCSFSWEVGIVLMFTKNCFHLSLYYCEKTA